MVNLLGIEEPGSCHVATLACLVSKNVTKGSKQLGGFSVGNEGMTSINHPP